MKSAFTAIYCIRKSEESWEFLVNGDLLEVAKYAYGGGVVLPASTVFFDDVFKALDWLDELKAASDAAKAGGGAGGAV